MRLLTKRLKHYLDVQWPHCRCKPVQVLENLYLFLFYSLLLLLKNCLLGLTENEGDFSPWASSFYSPFNHTEQRDDRVVLFADRLPPGVHVASFVARATTPGEPLM